MKSTFPKLRIPLLVSLFRWLERWVAHCLCLTGPRLVTPKELLNLNLLCSSRVRHRSEFLKAECLSFSPRQTMTLFAVLGKVTFITFCCVLLCHSCHSHCQEQKERKKQPLLKWDVCKDCFYTIILNAIQVEKVSIYVTSSEISFRSLRLNWKYH